VSIKNNLLPLFVEKMKMKTNERINKLNVALADKLDKLNDDTFIENITDKPRIKEEVDDFMIYLKRINTK